MRAALICGLMGLAACAEAEAKESLGAVHERLGALFTAGAPSASLRQVHADFLVLLDDPVGRGFVEQMAQRHDAVAYDELTGDLAYLAMDSGQSCVVHLHLEAGLDPRAVLTLPPELQAESLAVQPHGLVVVFEALAQSGDPESLLAGRYRALLDWGDGLTSPEPLLERAEPLAN